MKPSDRQRTFNRSHSREIPLDEFTAVMTAPKYGEPTSWWCDCRTHGELDRRARLELPRMRHSKFGHLWQGDAK